MSYVLSGLCLLYVVGSSGLNGLLAGGCERESSWISAKMFEVTFGGWSEVSIWIGTGAPAASWPLVPRP